MSNELRRQGLLLCLVGPSGAGKTEFSHRLLKDYGNIELSISATSRPPRSGEVDGKSYFFMSKEEFKRRVAADEFVEYEEVHGNLYGTLRKTIEQAAETGRDLLLDIDVKGAFTFKRLFPINTVICFVVPPNFAVLEERIQGRGQLPETELKARLVTARAEYQALRLAQAERERVDYLLVNDDREVCYQFLTSVLLAERSRFSRVESQELDTLLKVPKQ